MTPDLYLVRQTVQRHKDQDVREALKASYAKFQSDTRVKLDLFDELLFDVAFRAGWEAKEKR